MNKKTNSEALAALFSRIPYGTVSLRVVDGTLADTPRPKIKYSGKPTFGPCAASSKPPPSAFVAQRQLLACLGGLTGSWNLTIKVNDHAPIHWEYEEIEAPQFPVTR